MPRTTKAEHSKAEQPAEKTKEIFKSLFLNQRSQAEILMRHFLEAQKELLEFQLGVVEDTLRVLNERKKKSGQ